MDPKLSNLMRAYNLARSSAHRGAIDIKRLNRALGILRSKNGQERLANYNATIQNCSCPDIRQDVICKHRLARMLEFRAEHLPPPDWKEVQKAMRYGQEPRRWWDN